MPDDTAPEEITPTETTPDTPTEMTPVYEWPPAAVPIASPETATIPVPTPIFGPATPQPQTPPQTPLKASKKMKLLILGAIIIGGLGLLTGGTAAAYNLWYQNPDKVVFEALSSLMQQGTSRHKISVDVKSKGVSVQLTVDATLAEVPSSSSEMNALITYGGKDYNVKASTVTDKDGNIYVKVNDVKALLTKLVGSGADLSAFNAVIAKIDGQWIKISTDDITSVNSGYSKTQACTTKALKSLNDKAVVKEITDAYKANQFIIVGEKIGGKTIDGVGSLGYNVTLDNAKAKTFETAFGKTSIGKSLTACDSSFNFTADNLDPSTDTTKTTSHIQIWSSRFGHQFKELDISTKSEDGTTATIVWNPTFVKGLTVTNPTKSVPISEIVTDVENVFNGTATPQYSTRALQPTSGLSSGQKLLQSLTK